METLQTVFAGPWGPLVIFGLRIIDVSLATLRMLLIVRGQRVVAPLIGFFEVLIWLLAAGSAIRYLGSPLHAVGYAGGFAAGNAVGLWIEERLALGLARVQTFSPHGGVEVAEALRDQGFGVTEFLGRGREGNVELVSCVARRSEVPKMLKTIEAWDPEAFVTVDEPRAVHRGWLMQKRRK
jgi:uncharacterized protein YebE (UPF0316 family)